MLASGWVDPPSWSSMAFESGWVPPPKRSLRWNRPSCVQQGLPALRSVHKRTPRPHAPAAQAYAPRRSPGPDDANTPPRESPQLYHPLVYRG
ncbi:hypothetical protein M885DRAFT_505136 [Pelagophyceae sp. CCMP2097]|nr:hypothetical protein M885DRAFT_547698 [Pelagophyceae sp. CCMP2097]KAJ1462360.1 hypothetical protein M885DRAFT_505136 [Pelagophyceae sp. CCMP2097]